MLRRLIPPIVPAALVCILLWPVFQGRVLLPGAMLGQMAPWDATAPENADAYWNALTWDSAAFFYPSRALLGQAIRSGELPLWNPYQMCGMPFLADAQSAVLYPPNLLYAILPADRALNILAVLHLFLAGLFTYLFLKGLGLSRIASTFGGTAFMLGGFAIVWLELPVFLSTAVWLPLALHLSRIAHERLSIYHTAGAGVVIALSLLGGHPQIAFYCLLAVALYWIYLSVSGRRKIAPWRSLVLGCLAFAAGLALAAPQLLPSAELAALSHRGGLSPTSEGYSAYVALAMPIWRLIVLLAPDFFGNPSKGGMWVSGEYAEYCGYVGILTLILLPLAFLSTGEHRHHVRFFGGLAVLSLLMVLGTGVNRLLYFGVPGFARSGSPARALFLFAFSAAVLGAIGLDRLLFNRDARTKHTVYAVVLAGAGIAVLGVLLLNLNLDRLAGEFTTIEALQALLPNIGLFHVFFISGLGLALLAATGRLSREPAGVLAVGLLAADLLAFGMWYNPVSDCTDIGRSTNLTEFLQQESGYGRIMPLNEGWPLIEFPHAVLPPNLATLYGLFDVQGYDSLYPVRYKRLLDAAAGGDSSPPENGNMLFARNPDSPVYDLLSVRWVISRELMGPSGTKIDGCHVYHNGGVLPRAYLVNRIEYAGDEEILRRIVEGETDLSAAVLIDHKDTGILDLLPQEIKGAHGQFVLIRDYTCNSVTVYVGASQAGILVLTDQYFPGWGAFIDGKETRVVRANYAFRAVKVTAGEHVVRFSYDPQSFRVGSRIAFLAILVLFGIVIWSLFGAFRKARRRAISAGGGK